MVVLTHAGHAARNFAGGNSATFYATDIGTAGVDVFFVVSGFIIAVTGPLAERPVSGASFFWRRWSRVAPIYFLLSAPVMIGAIWRGQFSWPLTAATFLFWPAAGSELTQPWLPMGWTLGFEMLFYAAVSLAMVGGRMRRNLAILAVVVCTLMVARSFSGWNPLRILANDMFLEFGFGVALAMAWTRLRRADPRVGIALLALAISAFGVEAWVGVGDAISVPVTLRGDHLLWRVSVFGLPATLLLAGALICEQKVHGPLARALAKLGDASYATYLTQNYSLGPTVVLALTLLGYGKPFTFGAIVLAGELAFGLLIYRTLERPIQTFIRRLPMTVSPWVTQNLPLRGRRSVVANESNTPLDPRRDPHG